MSLALPLTPDSCPLSPGKTLAEAEREHISAALRETGSVVAGPKGAAARLGMKRSTLQEKMRKLGISRPQYCRPAGSRGNGRGRILGVGCIGR
jgi:transcriptional regulator with GAF, ATPase, and Fis domain